MSGVFRFPIRARVSALECGASHLNSELLVGSSMIVGSKGLLTCQEMAMKFLQPFPGLVDFNARSISSVEPPLFKQQSQKLQKAEGYAFKWLVLHSVQPVAHQALHALVDAIEVVEQVEVLFLHQASHWGPLNHSHCSLGLVENSAACCHIGPHATLQLRGRGKLRGQAT